MDMNKDEREGNRGWEEERENGREGRMKREGRE